MSHRNIIQLREIIDDPKSRKVYLIMDFYSKGTLLDSLNATENGLPEGLVKNYFRSILSAIHYCHEVQNLAHRDIKPANIMIDSSLDVKHSDILLCDFGCSEFFLP